MAVVSLVTGRFSNAPNRWSSHRHPTTSSAPSSAWIGFLLRFPLTLPRLVRALASADTLYLAADALTPCRKIATDSYSPWHLPNATSLPARDYNVTDLEISSNVSDITLLPGGGGGGAAGSYSSAFSTQLASGMLISDNSVTGRRNDDLRNLTSNPTGVELGLELRVGLGGEMRGKPARVAGGAANRCGALVRTDLMYAGLRMRARGLHNH